MESIGHILRSTRERKRISLSYAAAQTRIKLQYLELMEQDEFSRMPAPAYAKGFLRMYATFLGLEPQPLVQRYTDEYAGKRAPGLTQPPPASPSKPAPRAKPVPAPAPVVSAPEPVVAADESAEVEAGVPVPVAPVPKPPRKPRAPFKKPDFSKLKNAVAELPWRHIIMVFSVVVVVVLVANGLARCARQEADQPGVSRPVGLKKGVPATVQEPAEPYLAVPAESAEK